MTLRHIKWFIGEPILDPEVILYEILPYSPTQADQIIQSLCALRTPDLGQTGNDPARAQKIREAFRCIVDAARERQALLDLDQIERRIGKSPWRDRLLDVRNGREQFGSALGDKSVRTALRWALVEAGQAKRAGPRWLHCLCDDPRLRRETISRALNTRTLKRDRGRPHRLDHVRFLEGVSRAYELLTGRSLSRTVTTATSKDQHEGIPTGSGWQLALICLKPLDPCVTDHAVDWAMRPVISRRGLALTR